MESPDIAAPRDTMYDGINLDVKIMRPAPRQEQVCYSRDWWRESLRAQGQQSQILAAELPVVAAEGPAAGSAVVGRSEAWRQSRALGGKGRSQIA